MRVSGPRDVLSLSAACGYSRRMDEDERRNLTGRKRMIGAALTALDDLPRLLDVCAAVEGDDDDTRRAIASAFDMDDVEVDSVLTLQVRRFTPRRIQQMREELADVNARLEESQGV